MKRILIVAIISLLIPGGLLAQNAAGKMLGVMGSASEPPPPACTTSNDSAIFDKLGSGSTGDASAYSCVKWTAASNYTITEYISRESYTSGGGSIKACLLPHNGGTNLPGSTTCITGSDKSLSSFTGGVQNVTFTLATPLDISAGTYWVCNISAGLARQYIYHTSSGDRACYGSASCNTAATNTAVDITVNGCAR